MSKLIAAIMAALFAVVTVAPVAYAADGDKKATADDKKSGKKKGEKASK